jgi:hypothetical protein
MLNARTVKVHRLDDRKQQEKPFVSIAGVSMKLRYLNLTNLIDAAYLCGIDGTPVSLLIAMPPGSGKTWSTSSIKNADFVQYLNKVYSPNEHRLIIGQSAARTCLLINDDLGLLARWNQSEYYSTLCMVIDGELVFKQFRTLQHAVFKCSVVLCCTSEYYNQNVDNMQGMGLLDRLIPVSLNLSAQTREKYQEYSQLSSIFDNSAPARVPVIRNAAPVQDDLIREKNLDPRLMRNIRRISQYLSEDELIELINVANKPGRYSL